MRQLDICSVAQAAASIGPQAGPAAAIVPQPLDSAQALPKQACLKVIPRRPATFQVLHRLPQTGEPALKKHLHQIPPGQEPSAAGRTRQGPSNSRQEPSASRAGICPPESWSKTWEEEFAPLTQSQSLTAKDIQSQLPAGISRNSSLRRSAQQPSYGSLSASRTRRSAAGDSSNGDLQPDTPLQAPQADLHSNHLQFPPSDQQPKRQRVTFSEDEAPQALTPSRLPKDAPTDLAREATEITSNNEDGDGPTHSSTDQPAESHAAGFSRDGALFALMQHRLPSLSKSQGLQPVPEQLQEQSQTTNHHPEAHTASTLGISAQSEFEQTLASHPMRASTGPAANATSQDSHQGALASGNAPPDVSHEDIRLLPEHQQAELHSGGMQHRVASPPTDIADAEHLSKHQPAATASFKGSRDHQEDVGSEQAEQSARSNEAHGMQPLLTNGSSAELPAPDRHTAGDAALAESQREMLHINIQLNNTEADCSPVAQLSSNDALLKTPQQTLGTSHPADEARTDYSSNGTAESTQSPLSTHEVASTAAVAEAVNSVPLDTAKTAVLLANLPAPPGSAGLQPKSPRRVPSLLSPAGTEASPSTAAPLPVVVTKALPATNELSATSASVVQTRGTVSPPTPLAVVVPTADVGMPVASDSPVNLPNLPKAPGSGGTQQAPSLGVGGPQANGTRKRKVGQAILCCFMPRMQTDEASRQAFEEVKPNAASSSKQRDAGGLEPKQKLVPQGSGIKDFSGAIMSKLRGKPAESALPSGPSRAEALAGVADDDHSQPTTPNPTAGQSAGRQSSVAASGTWHIQTAPGNTLAPRSAGTDHPVEGAHPAGGRHTSGSQASGSIADPSPGSSLIGTGHSQKAEHAEVGAASEEQGQLETAMSIAPQPSSPGAMSRLVSIGKSGLGASKKAVCWGR